MRFNTLNDWLSWQESLHPTEIELGLERVGTVLARLELTQANFTLITVAGTNGKGSSVAMLEAILLAAGYRVGSYTSPHLLTYNERIKLDGIPADDAMLCDSFERIDQARSFSLLDTAAQEISLSYFEFGTLAAIDILHRANVDIAILEVGLGGRLDAVNVLDADVALITAIDVDHCDWLGNDRETIAREKAGIMRAGRPAVCADPSPPVSLLKHAAELGTPLSLIQRDFSITQRGEQWDWQGAEQGSEQTWRALPLPALPGAFQLHNAAGVLAVLAALVKNFPVDRAAICQGLTSVRLPGRFQVLPGKPMQILDVAHNAHSALALAENLRGLPRVGRIFVVLAMLGDKDIDAVVGHLTSVVDRWYIAPLDVPRAAPLSQLLAVLSHTGRNEGKSERANAVLDEIVEAFENVPAAHRAALAASEKEDVIVVCGSFHTVAAVLGDTYNHPLIVPLL